MKRIILFAVSISLVLLLAMSSTAAPITFELNFEYSGAFEPEGSPPWLTATFEDVGPNAVRLTMAAANLVGSEFVSGWYFNLDDSINPLSLGFSYGSSSSGPEAKSISTSQNGLSAGPAPGFDFAFNFSTSNKNGGALRFGAGDKSVYDISGIPGLNAASFDFTNESGTFYSAAHVQSIGASGGSGWIATGESQALPEPATLLSLGLGMLGLGLVVRRKFSK